MSTEAQIKANQQNSQKSTGPRSVEGKDIVSQNAVKHGLFGSEAVVKGEKQDDFDLFRDEMLAELAPFGAVESMLAGRVVSLSWRLKRVERMQNQALDVMLTPDESQYARLSRSMMTKEQRQLAEDPNLALGRAAIKDFSNSMVLDRLLIYERRIENSMFRTMAELQRLQLMREIEQAKAKEQEFGADIEVDLKKQSQFTPAQKGANSFVKEDYGNITRTGLLENKPKQSQFHAPALTERAGKGEKSLASTKSLT